MSDDLYYEFEDFFKQMVEATNLLKKMNIAQERMHWQFSCPKEYNEFVAELDKARDGWISSHC